MELQFMLHHSCHEFPFHELKMLLKIFLKGKFVRCDSWIEISSEKGICHRLFEDLNQLQLLSPVKFKQLSSKNCLTAACRCAYMIRRGPDLFYLQKEPALVSPKSQFAFWQYLVYFNTLIMLPIPDCHLFCFNHRLKNPGGSLILCCWTDVWSIGAG